MSNWDTSEFSTHHFLVGSSGDEGKKIACMCLGIHCSLLSLISLVDIACANILPYIPPKRQPDGRKNPHEARKSMENTKEIPFIITFEDDIMNFLASKHRIIAADSLRYKEIEATKKIPLYKEKVTDFFSVFSVCYQYLTYIH